MTKPDAYGDYDALQSFVDRRDETPDVASEAEIDDPLPLQSFANASPNLKIYAVPGHDDAMMVRTDGATIFVEGDVVGRLYSSCKLLDQLTRGGVEGDSAAQALRELIQAYEASREKGSTR